jgi:hypothetical protein
MDMEFICPKRPTECEGGCSGAGEEIEGTGCKWRIQSPGSEGAPAPAAPESGWGAGGPKPVNTISVSAAAKVEKHLKVPVHDKPTEKLVAKAAVPLEVAAKESDRTMRIKCIRHVDCVEVGHDKFDDTVGSFLGRIGERNIVSITTISYSIVDIASQKLLNDYGVMIIYKA